MLDKERLELYLDEMIEEISNKDKNDSHITADKILCNLLVDLGHEDIVNLYYQVGKWYA